MAKNSCPICGQPIAEEVGRTRYRPFCSLRCADVDLGRWLTGAYGIPAGPEEEDSGLAAQPSPEEEDRGGRREGTTRH